MKYKAGDKENCIDYSKVAFKEYEEKKLSIFNSLRRKKEVCSGVDCGKCL